MIINLDKEIDSDAVDIIANAYNNVEGNIDIYFSSNGGDNHSTSKILDMITKNKERTSIIACGHLFSNGFRLFFEAPCAKRLLSPVRGMYHLTRNTHETTILEGNKSKDSYSEFTKKNLESFSYFDNVNKLVDFTKEESKKIKAGEDVFFSEKRLTQMLKFNKK